MLRAASRLGSGGKAASITASVACAVYHCTLTGFSLVITVPWDG